MKTSDWPYDDLAGGPESIKEGLSPFSSEEGGKPLCCFHGTHEEGLLRTISLSPAIVFNGETDSDVVKFFFFFDNVVAKCANDSEKATQLLRFLTGKAFDFYYETYAYERQLIEEAYDYAAVKQVMIEEISEVISQKEYIRRAMNCRLRPLDMASSLTDIDVAFQKANFNDEAKFGLLRNAVMEHMDLAQYMLLRGARDYESLKRTIWDYVRCRETFSEAYIGKGKGEGKRSHATRIVRRLEETVESLENKVEELTSQRVELTLLVKKKQTSNEESNVRVCSFCHKPGHGANRCDKTPHQNTRCARCGKIGHSEATCWSNPQMPETGIAANDTHMKVEGDKPKDSGKDKEYMVGIVMEEVEEEETVNATKRDAEGKALPKQPKKGRMAVKELLNPQSGPVIDLTKDLPSRKRVKPKLRKPARKKSQRARKDGISDFVGRYNVLIELSNASGGLTFGQLLRGDAEEAKRQFQKLFVRNARSQKVAVANKPGRFRILKVVKLKLFGTKVNALVDSGAVPNLLSSSLMEELTLSPEATTRKIKVADRSSSVIHGAVKDVPVLFGESKTLLVFLVVDDPPVDVIIGSLTLENIQACIDMGNHTVTVTIEEKESVLDLEYDERIPDVEGSETDSEDLTSDSEIYRASSSSEIDEDQELVEALAKEIKSHRKMNGNDEGEGHVPLLLEEDKNNDIEEEYLHVLILNEEKKDLKSALLATKVKHLSERAQRQLSSTLIDSKAVAWSLEDLRPADVPVKHSFELKDPEPLTFRARRLPPRHNDLVRSEIDKMLRAGIITPTNYAWSFPILIATKKNGSPRFCVDYRALNCQNEVRSMAITTHRRSI